MMTLGTYCRRIFGEKLYKLSLDAGMSCPNRDGTLGTGGCIFCSAGGSGDFAAPAGLPLEQQLELAKERVAFKNGAKRYIAYLQAYTNTYAPAEQLEKLYRTLLAREDIAALSIATRPDCLPESVLELLGQLNREKPVWVELGLQTIHPATAAYIRRGWDLPVYDRAVKALAELEIHTVVHVILGLPGESWEEMLETVRYVACGPARGIKLQLLHVLRDTDLAKDWAEGNVPVMEPEEYAALAADCLALLPENMVVHRMTGDGPKRDLLAPLWSGDKKRVLNLIHAALRVRGITID